MSLSPIGASQVSALVLSRLLGTSGTNSADADSRLEQSSLDSLFISPEARWMSRNQEGDSFRADFENLGSLIQSGKLDDAKTAYAAMLQKMQAQSGGQETAPADFAAIGKALESGDATAAQSAWGSMQTNLAGLGGGSQHANPMQRDMDKLSALISSGDLASASTLFQNIQEKFKAGETGEAGTSTSGQSSTLDTRFSALETALKSGDAEGAKTAFASLQQDLQKTPPPPPSRDQASSGVSDLDALLLSSYLNFPNATSQMAGTSGSGFV